MSEHARLCEHARLWPFLTFGGSYTIQDGGHGRLLPTPFTLLPFFFFTQGLWHNSFNSFNCQSLLKNLIYKNPTCF